MQIDHGQESCLVHRCVVWAIPAALAENLGPWQLWQGEAVSLPRGQISVRVGTEDKADTGKETDEKT